ncbi:MAG TPA: EscU/YscU/HrcU family type III secretion system export apparatus switch protein [Albitalea sp.]|uniref:EscU/YscU/HrcU family type III secretion system export apparatus switch protein n=1 Tax=Piscinibacter sp. TaxID=1903157 RepID=UPI002ED1FF3F
MAEKTEKPTQKKLRDSREEGQVAKTPALGKILALAAVFELGLGYRNTWRSAFEDWITYAIRRGAEADGSAPYYLQGLVTFPVFQTAMMFSLAAIGLAAVMEIGASLLQVGIKASPKGMVHAEALNPVSNVSNMFSMQQVITLLLSIAKVMVIGTVASIALYASFDNLVLSAGGTLDGMYETFVGVIAFAERTSIILLAIFALLDWVVAYKQFMKQMMMSKEDIEQERKDMYGSKEVRDARRKFSRELLEGNPTTRTKRANAIVTNPTHFAVALRFNPHECPLPVVLARGQDEVALSMMKIGRDNGIPIIRSPELARTLYSVGREGHVIPRVALQATAAVYKAIMAVLEKGGDFEEVIDLSEAASSTAAPSPDE